MVSFPVAVRVSLIVALLAATGGRALSAEENVEVPLVRVTFTDAKKVERTIEGRIVVEAQDGGILLTGRDGRQWNVTPSQLMKREVTGQPFTPFTRDEAAAALKEELGDEFEIVTTKHYIIATRAGTRYAQWCAALFERLIDSFQTHWRGRPLDLVEPEFPLVAIILADEKQFAEFAASDVGPQAAAGAKGYYDLRSNRMVLYDLTAGPGSRPARTFDDIVRKIGQSPFNVATVVHEATHQIAFNSGLHARQADNPLWLTEGMAMYFETPDLTSRTGWKTIGRVNDVRLRQFRDYERRRPAESLSTLLADDARFVDPDLAADAYAEAWCLTHFLIRTRRRQYTEYLAKVAALPPLVFGGKEKRLEAFRESFGDLERLDRDFLRYMARLR